MPRGYRCILVALVGWLSLAAQAPDPTANAQQNATANAVSNAAQNVAPTKYELAERAHRTKYEAECDPPDDKRDSDLCAQWKAADSASKAADWTKWGAWASGISGFLVLIALGFAFEANRIARETAKRELRAYLAVEPGGINIPVDGVHRVPVNLINNGQTPAYNLEHGGDFVITTGDPRQFDPKIDGRLKELKPEDCVATSDSMLGPNTNRFSYAYLEEDLPKPFWEKIYKKEAAVIHYGFFRYKDAFDVQRQTNFAFYHWSEDLSAENAKRCRFGNDAT